MEVENFKTTTTAPITSDSVIDDNDNVDDEDDFMDDQGSYLERVGCRCDFDLLLSAQTSDEFREVLKNVERISNEYVICNGVMLELTQNLKDNVSSELFLEFVKAIVPEDSADDLERQTSRQFNDKVKRFTKQCQMKRKSKKLFTGFLDEPYNLRISEKAKQAGQAGQRKRRDLIEEAERAANVEILTYELVEAREKLLLCQSENTALTSQLSKVEKERDKYKAELERLKKENLELHLRLNSFP